jgi:hypothetical protein
MQWKHCILTWGNKITFIINIVHCELNISLQVKVKSVQISGLPIKRFLVYLIMYVLLHSEYSVKLEDDCRWRIGKDMERMMITCFNVLSQYLLVGVRKATTIFQNNWSLSHYACLKIPKYTTTPGVSYRFSIIKMHNSD